MARLQILLALAGAAFLAALVPTAYAQGGVFTQRLPILPDPNNYRLPFDQRQDVQAGFFLRNASPLGNVTTPQAIIVINRCGVLAPHFHPRGTEQLFVLSGQAEVVMFLEDNAIRRVQLTANQAVILPAGSVHYTRNTGYGQLQLVQTFDNPLAGTIFISTALLSLDRNIVNGALVGANIGGNVVPSSPIFALQC